MQNNLKKHSAESLKGEILDKSELYKYSNNPDGFFLSKLEAIIPHVKCSMLPSELDGTTIILITEGKLCITLKGENYYVNPNQLTIIQSEKLFTINVINSQTKGYICYFETNLILGAVNDFLPIHKFEFLNLWSPSIFDLNNDKTLFLKNLYERLYYEYQKELPNAIIISNYIMSLLLEIDAVEEKNISQGNKLANLITQSFKKNVYTNINQNFTIKKHAELLAITANHLNKCVKKTTGESASNFINSLKLTEAKYYLTQTLLPIATVASKIGYSDHSYFSRFFKKYVGITPKEYRENSLINRTRDFC